MLQLFLMAARLHLQPARKSRQHFFGKQLSSAANRCFYCAIHIHTYSLYTYIFMHTHIYTQSSFCCADKQLYWVNKLIERRYSRKALATFFFLPAKRELILIAAATGQTRQREQQQQPPQSTPRDPCKLRRLPAHLHSRAKAKAETR